jgi:hypothetical protein
MCCGEAFHGLGNWGVEDLILVGALFPLDGRGEEKERKKLALGRSVAAVRCN